MGYQSTLSHNVTFKDTSEARQALKWAREHLEYCEFSEKEFPNLEPEFDWTAKWYDAEKWVSFFAEYLNDGLINFIGEDGDAWGFEIHSGKAYEILMVKKRGKQIEYGRTQSGK
jgi:hypothetical protein